MAPNLPQIRISDVDILGDWDFDNVKALGDSIPGYQMSATFLTSLRSNLHLSACSSESPYTSLVSTPTSTAFSSSALLAHPTPSPLSISTVPSQTIPYRVDEPKVVRRITNRIAGPEKYNDRKAALKLIADSVAEQRQSTAKALLLHPYSVTLTVLLTGILARCCSIQALFALATSLIVTTSALLYWITRDYSYLAAAVNSAWLEAHHSKNPNDNGNGNGNSGKKIGKCEDPIVMVSKVGEAVVGALVLRVVKRERKGYVRAWTINPSHRGQGIGCGLLAEGVKVAWGKGARVMEFETEHANAHHVLPPTFSGSLLEQEARARRLLTDLVAEHRREKSSR